jgi:hypothetical protein
LFFPTVRIAVSSAKVAMVSFSKVGMSQVYNRYKLILSVRNSVSDNGLPLQAHAAIVPSSRP